MASLRERFEAWWNAHPSTRDPERAWEAWQAAYAIALDDAVALAQRNLGMTAQEYAQAIEALKDPNALSR